jgi:4-aminobutyrate aminotransferase-like enzyme
VAGAPLRPEVIEAFGKRIRYFNTFGGNPVSCAVAHAVLKVIKAGRRLVLISATGMKGRSEDPPAAGILVEGC